MFSTSQQNQQQGNRPFNNNNGQRSYNNNSNNSGFGGGNNNNQQENKWQDGPREVKPCRPITMRQLYTAQIPGEGIPVVDNRELEKVTVVGRIIAKGYFSGGTEQINAQALSQGLLEYLATDGSAKCIIKEFIPPKVQEQPELDENGKEKEGPNAIGNWVTATGSVKHIGNLFVINGSITPIEDQNEIIYHFLEAVVTHRRLTGLTKDKIPDNTFIGLTGGLRRDKKNGELNPVGGSYTANRDHNNNNNNNNNAAGGASPRAAAGGPVDWQNVENKFMLASRGLKGRNFNGEDVRAALSTSKIQLTPAETNQLLQKMVRDAFIRQVGDGLYFVE